MERKKKILLKFILAGIRLQHKDQNPNQPKRGVGSATIFRSRVGAMSKYSEKLTLSGTRPNEKL